MEAVDCQKVPCGFDAIFGKNLPHVLEKIFLSLDYESLKACFEVSYTWKKSLTSESFQMRAKSRFHQDIKDDQDTLDEACMGGNSDEVRLLLSFGLLDVNYPKRVPYESTPLNGASKNGHTDVVKLLLGAGAEPSKADGNGETPLHYVAKKGYGDVTKILLDGGAQPSKVNKNGRTPLHVAAIYGHNVIINILLDGGAKVNEEGECKISPLCWAIKTGYKHEIKRSDLIHHPVKTLLDRGAELNKLFHHTGTALHWAVICACFDDPYERDEEDMEQFPDWPCMVQFLLDAGADPNMKDESGISPTDLAVQRWRQDFCYVCNNVEDVLDRLLLSGGKTLSDPWKDPGEHELCRICGYGWTYHA